MPEEKEISEKVSEAEKKPEDVYLAELKKIRKEIYYNRIVMAIFFVIALFYIHQEAGRISDVLATFMEMLMPN